MSKFVRGYIFLPEHWWEQAQDFTVYWWWLLAVTTGISTVFFSGELCEN